MHILLVFSVLFTILSSSLITLIFENKKIYKAICCFSAVFFAQIVITYEFLSLFSIINPLNVIIINSIILAIAIKLYYNKGKTPDFKDELEFEFSNIKRILKQDKWLKALIVSYVIFIAGSLIFMYFVPANDEDALSYHIARLPFWYDAHNINHFTTADIRALIMPINSEIFYFWAYSFIKSDIFVRLFSFLSYILLISSLRGFLKILKISVKTSLWVILALSSLQNVMFAITGTETNISAAALILSALFLFTFALKDKNFFCIYFASLSYALAIGTKTTAIIVFPSFFVSLAVISYLFKKKDFYKSLFMFYFLLIINFLIFSSYNYVLNFIDFGNFITSSSGVEMHKFYGGYKGFFANIIRYTTMLFDFSGMPFAVQIWRLTIAISMFIMALFGIQPDINIITPMYPN